MLPTRDQIERAAYDRWLRRHQAHGYDRDDWIGCELELTYLVNYQTSVDHPLDSSASLILGTDAPRQCRLCERTARHVSFAASRPVVQGAAETSLCSHEVCDECQAECRDPLAAHAENLWKALRALPENNPVLPRHVDSMAVFKSLVTSALLIMPESELPFFSDTLDWLNNPDHEYDAGLFAGTYCHMYRTPWMTDRSSISLARRIDDDAPFPYIVCFLSWRGVVVQISVPLSVRDHDLDGRGACLPVRSLTAGEGPHFCEARPTVLRLVDPVRPPRAERRRALVLT